MRSAAALVSNSSVPKPRIPVAQGDVLELVVDGMADGPDGLCRVDGYVVLVAGVLPGERIEAEITSAARKFGRAELVRVLRPSPDRVEPRCRHFLACGGCQLQHARYEAQLQHKRQRLQRALQYRLGDAAPEVATTVAPPEPWGQRHKIALHLRDRDGELQPCFRRLRSIGLVEILECPASDEDGLDLAFTAVDELSRLQAPAWHPRLGGVLRTLLVRQSQGTGESHVVIVATEPPAGIDGVAARLQQAGATTVSLNLNDGPVEQLLGRDTRVLAGPPRIEERIGGLRYAISPDSFFQTAPAGAAALVELVLQWLQPKAADFVADLYCGGGLFALPLAQRSRRVLGIEQGFGAVIDAQHSAARNDISNAEFVHAAVEAQLHRWSHPRPDLIVLDPPRQGCGDEVAALLGRLGPRRVAYVSCDAEALAKDLAALAAHGLRAVRVTPVDMFPHTAHVEAVAFLQGDDRRPWPSPGPSDSLRRKS